MSGFESIEWTCRAGRTSPGSTVRRLDPAEASQVEDLQAARVEVADAVGVVVHDLDLVPEEGRRPCRPGRRGRPASWGPKRRRTGAPSSSPAARIPSSSRDLSTPDIGDPGPAQVGRRHVAQQVDALARIGGGLPVLAGVAPTGAAAAEPKSRAGWRAMRTSPSRDSTGRGCEV